MFVTFECSLGAIYVCGHLSKRWGLNWGVYGVCMRLSLYVETWSSGA